MARASTRSIDRLTAVLAPPVPKVPGPTFPGADERGAGPPGLGWSPPDPSAGTGWAPPGGAEAETPQRGSPPVGWGAEEPTGTARPGPSPGRPDERPGVDPARPGPVAGEEWDTAPPDGSTRAASWADEPLGSDEPAEVPPASEHLTEGPPSAAGLRHRLLGSGEPTAADRLTGHRVPSAPTLSSPGLVSPLGSPGGESSGSVRSAVPVPVPVPGSGLVRPLGSSGPEWSGSARPVGRGPGLVPPLGSAA